MSTRRERKKANRAAKLAAEEAAEKRARLIRTIRNLVIIAVVVVIVLVLTSCSSDDGDGVDDRADVTVTQPSGTEGLPDPVAEFGSTPCPPADGADEPVLDFDDAFENCLEDGVAYTAIVETTHGTVTVELDVEDHPVTANNFIALARSGYYDGTDLFRTEAGTGIIQGGSPHTQSNADPGPGYTIPDEGPAASADDYGPGTLAMARTAMPDSASGQFFFLATEGGRYLGDPAALGSDAGTYRVFGRTVEGLDVLEEIAALDDGSGQPGEDVAIERVTVTES